MWDGAELGSAASVYDLREGSRRTERLWLAESQLGAGVHREAGGDRRQSGAFPRSLLVLPYLWSDPGAWPWGSFHLRLAARPHPQQFNPHPSLLCSGGPGRVQIHFFFSLLHPKTNSKIPEKGVSVYMHAGVFEEGDNRNRSSGEGRQPRAWRDGLPLAPAVLVRPSRLCGIALQIPIPLRFCFQVFLCIPEDHQPLKKKKEKKIHPTWSEVAGAVV